MSKYADYTKSKVRSKLKELERLKRKTKLVKIKANVKRKVLKEISESKKDLEKIKIGHIAYQRLKKRGHVELKY